MGLVIGLLGAKECTLLLEPNTGKMNSRFKNKAFLELNISIPFLKTRTKRIPSATFDFRWALSRIPLTCSRHLNFTDTQTNVWHVLHNVRLVSQPDMFIYAEIQLHFYTQTPLQIKNHALTFKWFSIVVNIWRFCILSMKHIDIYRRVLTMSCSFWDFVYVSMLHNSFFISIILCF